MIEIMTDVPPGIIAVRSVGTLTKDEYDAVVVPMLEEAIRTVGASAVCARSGPRSGG